MILHELNILNYRNIREANLNFSDKINCFVGLNGQGKTNLLDAIYLLSFTKSAFHTLDNQNICYGEDIAMVKGLYAENMEISCGLKRGQKKQFRFGKKDYPRLIEHIGTIPLVMVSPEDNQLIAEGSDERRRFMDVVIAQQDRPYLEALTRYNALLKQRNALLKQYADANTTPDDLLEVFEQQMEPLAEDIFAKRSVFIEHFTPLFQSVYNDISDQNERVSLHYVSQLQTRQIKEAFLRTRSRDLILGWTSQGIHKDELEMLLHLPSQSEDEAGIPIKQVGSQGQQKTYLLALKLAQALYLRNEEKGCPILLLDDIFDKLDSERVARIIQLVQTEQFGQIFITDTDRQHLTQLIGDTNTRIFHIEKGTIL